MLLETIFFQEALVNRSLFNDKKGMYYVGKRSEKVAEFTAAWLVLMGLQYYAASKMFKNFMAHRVFFFALKEHRLRRLFLV